MDQQDQPLHVIQQVIDEVDAGPGQLLALVSGPLWFPGWSIRLFFPIFTTRGSSPAPYQLVQLRNKEQGTGGFCFRAFGSGSSTPSLTTRASASVLPRQGAGATLPSATADEGQGLSCCHDFRASSPTYHRQWRVSSLLCPHLLIAAE